MTFKIKGLQHGKQSQCF